MNDEPPVRLRPRKSKHGPNDNPRKYIGVLRSMLRLVQMSKRRHETRSRYDGQAEVPGRPARSISAWPSGSATPQIRIRVSGRHTERTWPARARRREEGRPRQGLMRPNRSLDIATTLDNWQSAGDERLFKIIVSPEFADRLNLQQYARELMRRMERDLGTQIEWVAAVHHNTEHPHVHIAVRGVDEEGRPLRLPREYIRAGLRGRAEEIATEALGYRTPADAQEAQRREIVQNRYTSLDRILQRSNDGSSSHFEVTANPNDDALSESAQILQKHVAARLMHLQTMGLAQFVAPHEWRVQADFEKVLRTLQQSGDRQKMLAAHGALVSDKRLPLQVTTLRQLQSVAGRVLLHTEDEQTGKRYMLVEGTDGKVHLIYHTDAIEEARKQGKLAVDNFIRIEKRFAKKKPVLRVDDLGDATALLQNSSYFHKEAELLLRKGIHDVQPVWGGWLGQYQAKLQTELHHAETRKRGDPGRSR